MPFPTPYYHVHYDPQPSLIRGQAKRTLTAEEFTAACELLLAHATRHRCRYWLLDGRADHGFRPPDIHVWLTEEYLPRARAALGRIPCLAFVVTPEFWQGLLARGYVQPRPEVPTNAPTAWFETEQEARTWLDQFRMQGD